MLLLAVVFGLISTVYVDTQKPWKFYCPLFISVCFFIAVILN